MKKTFKTLVVLTLGIVSLTLASCRKDNIKLPSSALSTYTGSLTYTPNTGAAISTTSGTATISGSKGNYTVSFSDGVPALTDLKFDKGTSGSYVSESSSGSAAGVTINSNSFNISATTQNGQWAFSGTKK